MAYALKYTSEFYQLKNYTTDKWKIEIYLEGYGGGSSEIRLDADSVVMSRDGELLDVVQGTKLTISIINTSEGEFKEFRDAAWGDYKVVLIKDPDGTPQNMFIWYNQSEIYTEPYGDPEGGGVSSVIEFTCGLRHLSFVRWDNSGTLYDSQKSMIEVIRLALNKLPSPLGVREIVNLYEDDHNATTTDSPLNQTYVSSETYLEVKNEGTNDEEAAFFCADVLEEILKPFGAILYQWEGYWYIIRPQEYNDSTLYYREFNANVGTESTITVDATGNYASNRRSITGPNGASTELILQANNSELSIQVPINRAKLVYTQNSLSMLGSNLIKNGDFLSLTQGTGANVNDYVPNFWTINNSDWTTYDAILIDSFGTPPRNWYAFINTKTATTYDSTVYMEQGRPAITTSTSDSMTLWFSARVEYEETKDTNFSPPANQHILDDSLNTFWRDDATVTWEIEIKIGSYYLAGDLATGYSWSLTQQNATFEIEGNMRLGWHGYTKSFSGGVKVETYYNILAFSQTLPTCPETAVRTFDIRIHRPYQDISTFFTTINNTYKSRELTNIHQSEFKLLYLPGQAPPEEELTIYSEIDEDENVTEIETIHGDGQNTLTIGSYRLSNGVITDAWSRRGYGESFEILEILLKMLRDMQGGFTKNLSGTLIGEFDVYNIVRDTYDGTVDYWIKDYTWNVVRSEWEVNLLEHTDFSGTLTPTTATGVVVTQLPVNTVATEDSSQSSNPEARITTSPSTILAQDAESSGDMNNLSNFN